MHVFEYYTLSSLQKINVHSIWKEKEEKEQKNMSERKDENIRKKGKREEAILLYIRYLSSASMEWKERRKQKKRKEGNIVKEGYLRDEERKREINGR